MNTHLSNNFVGSLPTNVQNHVYNFIYPEVQVSIWLKKYDMVNIIRQLVHYYGCLFIIDTFNIYYPEDSEPFYQYFRRVKDKIDGKYPIYFWDDDIMTNKTTKELILKLLNKMDNKLISPSNIVNNYKLASSYIYAHKYLNPQDDLNVDTPYDTDDNEDDYDDDEPLTVSKGRCEECTIIHPILELNVINNIHIVCHSCLNLFYEQQELQKLIK